MHNQQILSLPPSLPPSLLQVTGTWAGFYDYNTLDQSAILGNYPDTHNPSLYPFLPPSLPPSLADRLVGRFLRLQYPRPECHLRQTSRHRQPLPGQWLFRYALPPSLPPSPHLFFLDNIGGFTYSLPTPPSLLPSLGHGLQQAPAAGRAISELLLQGKYTSLDLSRLGLERVIEKRPLYERNVV